MTTSPNRHALERTGGRSDTCRAARGLVFQAGGPGCSGADPAVTARVYRAMIAAFIEVALAEYRALNPQGARGR